MSESNKTTKHLTKTEKSHLNKDGQMLYSIVEQLILWHKLISEQQQGNTHIHAQKQTRKMIKKTKIY